MTTLAPTVLEDRIDFQHDAELDDNYNFIGCICGWRGVDGFAEHVPAGEKVHTRATGVGFEGWAHSRSWHYWRGSGSLCGRVYGYAFVRSEPGSGRICAGCREALRVAS